MHEDLEKIKAEKEVQRKVACCAELIYGDTTTHRLFESLVEGVLIVAAEGTIVLTNSRVEEMFGYEARELQGQHIDLLVEKNVRSKHTEHMAGFFAEPRIRPMGVGVDINGVHKDGSLIPLEIGLSFLELQGEKYGLAFVSNISLRKEVEQLLHVSNQQLEQFAQIVAHDLNDDLCSMVSVCQLLRGSGADLQEDRRNLLLDQVLESGLKMSSIIREMLLFARMDHAEVRFSPVDMGPVLESVLHRLRHRADASKAKISVGEVSSEAIGYAPWVEEVWYNYISNAIAYGGKPPEIEVGGERYGDRVRFWVRDNGQGVPEESIKYLFLENSGMRRRVVQGNGLGLSIVKGMVERMNGSVAVESTLGEGSTFLFELDAVPLPQPLPSVAAK